jgi:hypothetical protein
MKFYCTDDLCPFEESENYMVEIADEMCLDVHNIASPICPYCQNPMLSDVEELALDV